MFTLKDKIFGYFGKEEAATDTYKDVDGKGLLQRYNEAIAEDFDEEFVILVENMVENTVDPLTALEKFLPYLEEQFGVGMALTDDLVLRRKILRYINRFNSIKGTKLSYELLFALIGVTVVITEHFDYFTLDDAVATLDDDARTLDSSVCAQHCTDYSLELTGAGGLTPELVNRILSVIEVNEPINADLREVTYNGGPVVQEIINIFVSADGDLQYTNVYDPDLILYINSHGDLIIAGGNASKYSIDEDGNLIFTV